MARRPGGRSFSRSLPREPLGRLWFSRSTARTKMNSDRDVPKTAECLDRAMDPRAGPLPRHVGFSCVTRLLLQGVSLVTSRAPIIRRTQQSNDSCCCAVQLRQQHSCDICGCAAAQQKFTKQRDVSPCDTRSATPPQLRVDQALNQLRIHVFQCSSRCKLAPRPRGTRVSAL